MELVLMGVAGCSAIDMISILKQRQILSLLRLSKVIVSKLERQNHSNIHVVFYLEGPINEEKKAAELSFEKYCSVSKL
jgi:putative redox protein